MKSDRAIVTLAVGGKFLSHLLKISPYRICRLLIFGLQK